MLASDGTIYAKPLTRFAMSYALDCRTLQSTPANTALEHGITLKVVKLSEAKRGFMLLPAPLDG